MTWDRRLYFPSEGRHAEDFFALKNPTASAGFEPANLGTKGQHATPTPPKALIKYTIHKNKYTINYPSSRVPFPASAIIPVLQCTTFQNLALLPSWDEQNKVKKKKILCSDSQ